MENELTADQLAILDQSYPVTNDDDTRLILPRFGMLSKDITKEEGSGKEKTITVVEASGTFFIERDLGEKHESGKKKWTREYVGDIAEVVIMYHRKQLRKYDKGLNKFYSTPIFDDATQIIPLYLDGQIVKKGTQKDLQACYPALTQKGKPTSDLKEETILYVLYKGEMLQCNLTQSSKYAFLDYKRTLGSNPASVVTKLSSEEDEFGTNKYRKMKFEKARGINGSEFTEVLDSQKKIKDKVEADKRFFVPEIAAPVNVMEAELIAESNKKL